MNWMKILIGYSIALGCLLIGLIIIMDKVIMPIYVHHGDELTLPDITGKNVTEARQILNRLGLQVKEKDQKVEPAVPPKTILQQNPLPNTTVKKGRRIYVIVSTPEKPIIVPYVIGRSRRDAEILIQETGLIIDTLSYDFYSYWPEGTIGEQSIPGGNTAPKGVKIMLTVSLGSIPTEIIVPDLFQKHLNTAKEELRKAGLKTGKIIYEINNNLLPNTVIGQDPELGTAVSLGDSINIWVSITDSTDID